MNRLRPEPMKAASHWELNCAESSVMSLVKSLALKMAFVDALILQGGRRSSISSAQGWWLGRGWTSLQLTLSGGEKVPLKIAPLLFSPALSKSTSLQMLVSMETSLLLNSSACPPSGWDICVVWSGDEPSDSILTHYCQKAPSHNGFEK